MKEFAAIAILLCLLILGLIWFDGSELSPVVSRNLLLVDKWHEEPCTPIYGDKGTYLGESCTDEWTLVVLEGTERDTIKVSKAIFRKIRAGQRFTQSFRVGRLGGVYNETFQLAE